MVATAAHPASRPSGELIDAVLQLADVREDLGGGRVLHRLSAKQARTRRVRDALGRDAARAAEVSVVWDEREGQLFRVFETPATPRRFDENDSRWWSHRDFGLAA